MFIVGIAAGLTSSPAAGAPATTWLRDGVHLRSVERLDTPPTTGATQALRALRWAHTPVWVGRQAIVSTGGGDDAALFAALGLRPLRPLMPALGMWLVESADPAEDGLAVAERLQRHPSWRIRVKEALPDLYVPRRTRGITLPPDDPRYPGQWFFAKLAMEDAWRIESGKPEVSIAIIDNGCDLAHPDLVDKLDPGRDALGLGAGTATYTPNSKGNDHGTACAGLAAASTDNHLGVAGACPGCRLRCVRLLNDAGGGLVPTSADVDAFQFVLDAGVAVASNSWGFTTATPAPQPLVDAIELVHTQGRGGLGTLVVFAAGNDSRELGPDELESVPAVTTVGAVNNFGELAQFSNTGAAIAVVAPTGTSSTDISGADGADPSDYLTSFGGTSSACPIVAGVLGLMVSAAPTRSAVELESALKMTAKQSPFATPDASGHDLGYGFGVVQPAAALLAVAPAAPPMMPPPSGCGCALGGDAPPAPAAALLALLAFGAALVTRARRRR